MGWWYRPKSPINVKGGIRSHSKSGEFGTSWWSKKWNDELTARDVGARLGRGRSYLRRGQITSVNIREGTVTAHVQGSSNTPYEVRIDVNTLSENKWKKLVSEMFARPVIAAKLLTGHMPRNIEKIFKRYDVSLFPKMSGDVKMNCSCYDWANPCKHLVAIYLLIGEELDRDPFLLFTLRGATRKKILEMAGFTNVHHTKTLKHSNRKTRQRSLPVRFNKFWGYTADYDPGDARIPDVSATLPKWLGNFQFWRSDQEFMPSMEELYGYTSDVWSDIFTDQDDS